MADMTHDQLVSIGRRWLATRSPVVVSEIATAAGESPDVLGFQCRVPRVGYGTHLIECKASRADFLADRKKRYRRHPEQGMGNFRYFLVPQGLVTPEEMPENWGLLYADSAGRVSIRHVPRRQEANRDAELTLMVSVMRRLRLPAGDHVSLRVKTYEYETNNTAVLELVPDPV